MKFNIYPHNIYIYALSAQFTQAYLLGFFLCYAVYSFPSLVGWAKGKTKGLAVPTR